MTQEELLAVLHNLNYIFIIVKKDWSSRTNIAFFDKIVRYLVIVLENYKTESLSGNPETLFQETMIDIENNVFVDGKEFLYNKI